MYNVEFFFLSLLNCCRIWFNLFFVVRGFVVLVLIEVVCLEFGDLECGVDLLDFLFFGDFEVVFFLLVVMYFYKL